MVKSILILLTLAATGSVTAYADFWGIGEAAAGIADASWKIVLIRAVEAAQFSIMLIVVAAGLYLSAAKFMEMAGKFSQDNKFTITEKVVSFAAIAMFGAVAALLLPLGFALLARVFE